MRLIDANKLHLTYKQGAYIGHGVYDGEGYYVDGNEVANASAVEAIPIEWIKKQLKEEKYRTFLVDHIEWSACLHWLLESWEQENK